MDDERRHSIANENAEHSEKESPGETNAMLDTQSSKNEGVAESQGAKNEGLEESQGAKNEGLDVSVREEIGDSRLLLDDKKRDEVITLHVGGMIFKSFASTLLSVPDTRLSRLCQRIQSENKDDTGQSKEHFFDRNPAIFECVLELYRSGELHFPRTLCTSTLKRDLDFWDIPLDMVSECCQDNITAAEKEVDWRRELKSKFSKRELPCPPPGDNACWLRKVQYKLWIIVDDPASSIAGGIYGAIYFLFVIGYIVFVILSSHPYFRVLINYPPLVELIKANVSNPKEVVMLSTLLHPVLSAMKLGCFIFFFSELFIRFLLFPSKKAFFKSFVNILDSVCLAVNIVHFTYAFSLQGVHPLSDRARNSISIFLFLSCVCVLRVIRLLTFAYHFSLMRVLILSLYESWKVLFLMIVVLVVGMLIYSPLVYLAEFHEKGSFHDIPTACWWAIVTMTTVGYGDQHPQSFPGYIVGALCALSGIVITALPIAVVGNNFHHFYTYYKDCKHVLEEAKQFRKDSKYTEIVVRKKTNVSDTNLTGGKELETPL